MTIGNTYGWGCSTNGGFYEKSGQKLGNTISTSDGAMRIHRIKGKAVKQLLLLVVGLVFLAPQNVQATLPKNPLSGKKSQIKEASEPATQVSRRRKKKSSSKTKRDIKEGKKLGKKKEAELDDAITKTKDLKPAAQGGDRPTLTPEQLQQAKLEGMVEDKIQVQIETAEQMLEISPSTLR